MSRRILILGAAGRDFHDFNVAYRDDPAVEVVAFTATQIPGIADRRYPAVLAGARYPHGIPIEDEARLEALIARHRVDEVVFAYSDVSHAQVMALGSRALAAGCDFSLLGPQRTMLACAKPVVAVSAVRTGCGKSALARWIAMRLRAAGRAVAVLRHPMPYGDLAAMRVQRFATLADLDAARCTAEEREEYEPHIAVGNVVFAGVDYAAIREAAQAEADVIVWDGGNNDFPFLRPTLHLAMVDPWRPEQVTGFHPGETVLRMADVVVVGKTDTAPLAQVEALERAVRAIRPDVPIVRAVSPIVLDDPAAVRGKRVLVVEDGPTVTHGGMAFGAGYLAAKAAGAAEIVDPRVHAPARLRAVFERYPHLREVLPAMGYSPTEIDALREAIRASDAQAVVAGTPLDLARLLCLDRPVVRARYAFAEATPGRLEMHLRPFVTGD